MKRFRDLEKEARVKLAHLRPENLGQAHRVSGVSPSDISVLMVALMKRDSDPTCGCDVKT